MIKQDNQIPISAAAKNVGQRGRLARSHPERQKWPHNFKVICYVWVSFQIQSRITQTLLQLFRSDD